VSYKTKPPLQAVLLQIELVLHRETKYQAKHVEFWVHVDGVRTTVIVANVAGILFEDALNRLVGQSAPPPQQSLAPRPVDTRLPSEYPVPKDTGEFMPKWPPIRASCPYMG